MRPAAVVGFFVALLLLSGPSVIAAPGPRDLKSLQLGFSSPTVAAVAAGLGVCAALATRAQGTSVDGPSTACDALVASGREFRRARSRKLTRGNGVSAAAYTEAMEVLMPAFQAYGAIFDRAFRKDVLGNIGKIRALAKATGEDKLERLVLLDPFPDKPEASVARALFWLNRIAQQIALTFEHLIDDKKASLVQCATAAYLKTCAPFNTRAHQAIARIMSNDDQRRRRRQNPASHGCLRLSPSQAHDHPKSRGAVTHLRLPEEQHTATVGPGDFDSLAQFFRTWIAESKPVRDHVDLIFKKHPNFKPRYNRRAGRNFKAPEVKDPY